jgi:hypothetical protein
MGSIEIVSQLLPSTPKLGGSQSRFINQIRL